MKRLIVILLVSWAYVGCASRGVPGAAGPHELRPGGVIRVAVDDRRIAAAVVAGAVSQPLAQVARAAKTQSQVTPVSSRVDPAPPPCELFHFDPPALYPDGAAILPQELVVDLQERLLDPDSDAGWLLAPVDGVPAFETSRTDRIDGLFAEGVSLAVCPAGPTPDLATRLAHPDLQFARRDPDGLWFGPGPFMQDASGALVPNAGHSGRAPLVDGVRLIVTGDPGLLLRLDEADAALLYGESAGRLLADPPSGMRLERAPAWDRHIVLTLNPQARWLNDPRFRRWVAGIVDRPAMLQYLFAGGGAPAWDLLGVAHSSPEFEAVDERPVSPASAPRFALAFDAADRQAEKIAARIKAGLRAERVEVTLLPTPRGDLRQRLREGRVQAALVAGEPFFQEPLLRLRETCARIGAPAGDAILVLDQASRLSEPEARFAAALAAQDILLRDAVAVPLLRLHAWLGTRSGLSGVRAGPRRVLQFEEAGWLP